MDIRKPAQHYIAGTWLAICDRCGFQHRNTELKLEWTGLRVCHECFEHRHPLDGLRGIADRQAAPWTRPEATDVQPFVNDGGTDVDPAVDL